MTICCKICSNLIKVAEDDAYSDEFLPYVKGKLPFWFSLLIPLILCASAEKGPSGLPDSHFGLVTLSRSTSQSISVRIPKNVF